MAKRKPTPEQLRERMEAEAAQRARKEAERHSMFVAAAKICVDAPPLIAGGTESLHRTRERIEADELETRLEMTGILLVYSRMTSDEVRRLVCDTSLPFASDRMIAEWWEYIRFHFHLQKVDGAQLLELYCRSAETLVGDGMMSSHVMPVIHPIEDALASERVADRRRRAEMQEWIWKLSKEVADDAS